MDSDHSINENYNETPLFLCDPDEENDTTTNEITEAAASLHVDVQPAVETIHDADDDVEMSLGPDVKVGGENLSYLKEGEALLLDTMLGLNDMLTNQLRQVLRLILWVHEQTRLRLSVHHLLLSRHLSPSLLLKRKGKEQIRRGRSSNNGILALSSLVTPGAQQKARGTSNPENLYS